MMSALFYLKKYLIKKLSDKMMNRLQKFISLIGKSIKDKILASGGTVALFVVHFYI
jgi:hypothetical protein